MSLFNLKFFSTVGAVDTVSGCLVFCRPMVSNLTNVFFKHFYATNQGRKLKAHQGFSLIELIIVIAIVGILAAISAPSFRDMIARNALNSATQDLRTALRYARSEAISTGQTIDVCTSGGEINDAVSCAGSTQDWSRGFIVYNANSNEVLSRASISAGASLDVQSDRTVLTFGANGFITGAEAVFDISSTRISASNKLDVYSSGLSEFRD